LKPMNVSPIGFSNNLELQFSRDCAKRFQFTPFLLVVKIKITLG